MADTSDHRGALRGNRLLSALPSSLASEIADELEDVTLEARQGIYLPGETIEDVYFPVDSVQSIVADMGVGTMIEVATVGSEGMVGIPVLLYAGEADYRVFTQVSGRALRLPAARLLEVVKASDEFARLLYRYIQVFMTEIARSAACNRTHSIDERAARWLLLTNDRVGRDDFVLTQEFLAQMLGVRRASVSSAAGMLQRAGFITYSRGQIRVLDRAGLESAACECYGAIRDEYDRLLNVPDR